MIQPTVTKETARRSMRSKASNKPTMAAPPGMFAKGKKASVFVTSPSSRPVTAVQRERDVFDDSQFFDNVPKPEPAKKIARGKRKKAAKKRTSSPPQASTTDSVISQLEFELLDLSQDMEIIAEELDSSLRRIEQSPAMGPSRKRSSHDASVGDHDLQCEEESIFQGIGDAWLG